MDWNFFDWIGNKVGKSHQPKVDTPKVKNTQKIDDSNPLTAAFTNSSNVKTSNKRR